MIVALVEQTSKLNINLGWPAKMGHWPSESYIQKILFLYKPDCGLWDQMY